ncbi:MAG TPA: hypothetical protein VFV23_11525 [Verrucomicrobiae bacterium]|nr:hypothetical protein [Verrucomicrobiae bacterium]
MKTDDLISGLPGEELISQGLSDLENERHTAPACLISIARTRLSNAGLSVPPMPSAPEPELQLYRLLCREGGDAYSRYNSLVRRLVSFEQALDHRRSRRPMSR